jgi:hypothetical protein
MLNSSVVSRAREYEDALADLNHMMEQLSLLFPNIMPVVFREMLIICTGESALHVVADQLLKYPEKWVQGRWKTSIQETGLVQDIRQDLKPAVPVEERFRREEYKQAARSALYEEFRSLRKSTIDAVTAENNHSYTRARPILQGIEAKSWRRTFKNLFSKPKRPTEDKLDKHYMLVWARTSDGLNKFWPRVRETKDFELDEELHEDVLSPLLERERAKQEKVDFALALRANEEEARDAQALYECECCFHDASFEQIATCTSGGHVSCFSCISRAATEALYGQSWLRNIDHIHGSIRCLTPSPRQECSGCIPLDVAQRAIIQNLGVEPWLQLESSIAKEALSKTGLPLIHCPFCSYAEIDDPSVTVNLSHYRLNTSHVIQSISLCLLALILLPLMEGFAFFCRVSSRGREPNITLMISTSLARLYNSKYRSRRFICCSPQCALPSCISCRKVWSDPHICFESTALSLRKTIETARTAALKRTCPQCGLGFIKESGCNKLTCRCGHTMCYICRQGLGQFSGGEAYSHFCQHFRPAGGKCGECERCDLYQAPDEDTLVRRAGEIAEKEWRKRDGMEDVDSIGGISGVRHEQWQCDEQWTLQGWMDWWVRKCFIC